jgi:hypothetical protein
MNGLGRVLRAGGMLLFSGASELDPGRTGAQVVEQLWHGVEPRLVGRWQKDQVVMIELACNERQDDAVVCHHFYVVEEGGQVRLETARYTTLCRWSWQDYQQAASRAGFKSIESRRLELGGRTKTHNIAIK